jgi:putative hydrolase of the HAD superfamily
VAPAYRAVLFDALGTLVELEPPWPRLRATLSERHAIQVSEPDARRALVAEMVYYRSHHLLGGDPASLEELRRRCAEVLRDSLPALGPLSLGEVKEALLDSLRFVPYADAAPALAELRRAGLRLAVVSNWDCSLGSVLAELGLGAALDAIVVSAEVKVAKPDPAIFRAALERLGAGQAEALVVGDSAETDVEGARAAGLRALLLDRSEAPKRDARHDPERIFSLAELVELARAGA